MFCTSPPSSSDDTARSAGRGSAASCAWISRQVCVPWKRSARLQRLRPSTATQSASFAFSSGVQTAHHFAFQKTREQIVSPSNASGEQPRLQCRGELCTEASSRVDSSTVADFGGPRCLGRRQLVAVLATHFPPLLFQPPDFLSKICCAFRAVKQVRAERGSHIVGCGSIRSVAVSLTHEHTASHTGL